MSRFIQSFLITALITIAFTGCSQGGTDTASEPIDAPTAQDTPPAATEETTKPAPEPVAGPIKAPGAAEDTVDEMKTVEELVAESEARPILSNVSFENWIDGLPVVWRGNYTGEGMNPEDHITPVTVAHDGDRAMRLRAAGKRIGVWQPVSVGGKAWNNTVVAEAYVKNPVPPGLIFRYTYEVAGEPVNVDGAIVEEGEEWSRMRLSFVMPQEGNPGSSKLSFVIRDFVEAAAIIDSVSVWVEE